MTGNNTMSLLHLFHLVLVAAIMLPRFSLFPLGKTVTASVQKKKGGNKEEENSYLKWLTKQQRELTDV